MILSDVVEVILEKASRLDRVMVAVAGPPGAGKSTVSQELVRLLPENLAKLVPMDGFHYDNAVLDELGLRHRKGAPETFDFAGFMTTLKRIRQCEPGVAVPVFEREKDLARAGASLIGPATKVILVEGNYLRLDEPPWTDLDRLFDLTMFLEVDRDELERRLLQRWRDLGDSEEKARSWVASNDMPNVDRVLSRRRCADIIYSGR